MSSSSKQSGWHQTSMSASYNNPNSTANKCKECGGSGWVVTKESMRGYIAQRSGAQIYGEEDFETWVQRKCPKCNGGFAARINAAMKVAGIPSTFYDKRLDSFDWNLYIREDGTAVDTSSHQKAINSFVSEFDNWERKNMGLFIWSTAKGTGKSFLASCICNELMCTRAIRTRFVNASDLIDLAQSGDKDSPEEYKRDPLKLLQDCKFLVLDDVGQRQNSDWLEDILYKILDARMRNGRLTIITANMNIDNLPFDDRIGDRISSMCLPIHLPETKVRSKESRDKRTDFLKEMGLIT